jgi:transcriptional regulator NrdR family protein
MSELETLINDGLNSATDDDKIIADLKAALSKEHINLLRCQVSLNQIDDQLARLAKHKNVPYTRVTTDLIDGIEQP